MLCPQPFLQLKCEQFRPIERRNTIFGFATSNGDGINDFWAIRNLDLYENFNLRIFDLNDNLLFQADDSNTETIIFFPQIGE
ncbi:gliding motility-associated C-terminal domain-containing protein [Zobellia galactanivorans]|uniref:T9SS type B sorting domain-containing protein n=1 Tax=Zobellia galactanivorans (strain DSM 12802 / CCUG 47099 / CIP 106680 / NCIMB 13871 / Dsij) TaxID=63186 RepID=UPI00349F5479